MSAARYLSLPHGRLDLARCAVMGILNVTPDSFYDGGRYRTVDRAVTRAVQMAEEGARIIDIGGEKAGPGRPVSAAQEIDRVVPVITAVKRETGLAVSIDTFKPNVAAAAVDAGADIINSIGGFVDPAMRAAAARSDAAIVIMHIQGRPRVANPHPVYGDVVSEVRSFLLDRVHECLEAGIPADRIVIDPGPGFGKNTEHDLAVLSRLDALTALPYPVLLAASRKKFIGEILGSAVNDRLEGSLAVVAWGVLQGAAMVRTHDVQATVRVCRMIEAVLDPSLVSA